MQASCPIQFYPPPYDTQSPRKSAKISEISGPKWNVPSTIIRAGACSKKPFIRCHDVCYIIRFHLIAVILYFFFSLARIVAISEESLLHSWWKCQLSSFPIIRRKLLQTCKAGWVALQIIGEWGFVGGIIIVPFWLQLMLVEENLFRIVGLLRVTTLPCQILLYVGFIL